MNAIQTFYRAVAPPRVADREGRKLVSNEQIIRFVERAVECTIRDVSDGLGMNHETATGRMRQLVRMKLLLQQGDRMVDAGGDRPYRVPAKLYRAPEREIVEQDGWVAGHSLEAMGVASCERMLREEVSGALQLWGRWARAGRLRLNWHGDTHLALSLALDAQIARLEPHLRAAVELTHGLRKTWGWLRHDAHESYDEALIELTSIYRLPEDHMGGATRL